MSGTETITTAATERDGIEAIRRVRAGLEGERIWFTVYSGMVGESRARPVSLGKIDAGTYSAVYRSPGVTDVQIGTLDIP